MYMYVSVTQMDKLGKCAYARTLSESMYNMHKVRFTHMCIKLAMPWPGLSLGPGHS